MFVNAESLNLVLVAILAVFVGWGIGRGFIRAVGGILAFVVAVIIASRFYLTFGQLIQRWLDGYSGLVNIVSFALLFLLIGQLCGIVIAAIEKAYNLISFVPFLKSINRILGGVFGLVLGLLFTGAILYIASKYSIWAPFNDAVTNSSVSQWIISVSWPVRYFFPTDVLQLRSYF